jgi:hypothetical protein
MLLIALNQSLNEPLTQRTRKPRRISRGDEWIPFCPFKPVSFMRFIESQRKGFPGVKPCRGKTLKAVPCRKRRPSKVSIKRRPGAVSGR